MADCVFPGNKLLYNSPALEARGGDPQASLAASGCPTARLTPGRSARCQTPEDENRFAETSAGALLLPAGQQRPTSPHRLRAVPHSTPPPPRPRSPSSPGGRCPAPAGGSPGAATGPGSGGCAGSGAGRRRPAAASPPLPPAPPEAHK